jgi:hypothetical protein
LAIALGDISGIDGALKTLRGTSIDRTALNGLEDAAKAGRAKGIEEALERCERAGDGGETEQGNTQSEGPFRSDPVGQVPTEQQQRRKRQRVAVDHPLLADGAATELTVDLGQRDVDDQDVQRDQKESGCGQQQRQLRPCSRFVVARRG